MAIFPRGPPNGGGRLQVRWAKIAILDENLAIGSMIAGVSAINN